MKERNRAELFETVQSLMAYYCDGCFLYKYVKEAEGKRAAHRFCITQCTVGEKLKECGKKLS